MNNQLTSFKARSNYTKLTLFEEATGLERETVSKEGKRIQEEEGNMIKTENRGENMMIHQENITNDEMANEKNNDPKNAKMEDGRTEEENKEEKRRKGKEKKTEEQFERREEEVNGAINNTVRDEVNEMVDEMDGLREEENRRGEEEDGGGKREEEGKKKEDEEKKREENFWINFIECYVKIWREKEGEEILCPKKEKLKNFLAKEVFVVGKKNVTHKNIIITKIDEGKN